MKKNKIDAKIIVTLGSIFLIILSLVQIVNIDSTPSYHENEMSKYAERSVTGTKSTPLEPSLAYPIPDPWSVNEGLNHTLYLKTYEGYANSSLITEEDHNNLTWTVYQHNESVIKNITGENSSADTLTFVPADNWYGNTTVGLRLWDINGAYVDTIVNLTWLAVNEPPYISPTVPDQYGLMNNNIVLNLTPYENDTPNESTNANLKWYVTSYNTSAVSAILGENSTTDIITFVPKNNWYGTTHATLVLWDEGGLTDWQDINLSWSATGVLNMITIPNPYPALENMPIVLYLASYEENNIGTYTHNNLTWTVPSYNTSFIKYILGENSSDDKISIAPADNYHGSTNITLRLWGKNSTNISYVEQVINLTWSSVNEPPTIVGNIGDKSALEDAPIAINLTAFESDVANESVGSGLVWYVTSWNSTVIQYITGQNSTTNDNITFYPKTDWYGTTNVTLVLKDEGNLTDYQVINLTWTPVNDNPYISPSIPTPWAVDEDTPLIIDFSAYENDKYGESVASNLTWYVSYDNTKITSASGQNSSTDIIKFTPVTDWWGNTTVTMTLIDANGTTANQTITLQWLPVSEPPYISPAIPDQTANEDNPITITLTTYENDYYYEDNNASLKWYATSYDTKCIKYITGENSTNDILSIYPQDYWYGTTNITFILWDSGGLKTYQVVNLTLNSTNDGPYISPAIPTPWAADESTPIIIDFSPYENDRYGESNGAGLKWYVSSYDNSYISSISGMNSTTDIIKFTPVAYWYGSTQVTMVVEDENGTTNTQNITLTWWPVNDPPYISPNVPDQIQNENSAIAITLTTYEHDQFGESTGTELRWYATSYDSRYIKFITGENSTNDVISIYPVDYWYGTTNITLVLRDVNDSKAYQVINLTWSPVNYQPYISPTIPNPWPVDEDTPLIVDFSAYENDRYGESVASNLTWYASSWSYSAIQSIIGNNDSTDIIKFTPVTDWFGSTAVTMTLVDANGTTASQSITLQWLPVSEAPYISPVVPDPPAVNESSPSVPSPIIINLTAYENDHIYEDDNASLKWYTTSYDTRYIKYVTGENSTGDLLSIYPQDYWYGTTNITLVLVDSDGLKAYQVINLTWLPINQPPYIAENLVVNGDFEDGITGWSRAAGTSPGELGTYAYTVETTETKYLRASKDYWGYHFFTQEINIATTNLFFSAKIRPVSLPAGEGRSLVSTSFAVYDAQNNVLGEAKYYYSQYFNYANTATSYNVRLGTASAGWNTISFNVKDTLQTNLPSVNLNNVAKIIIQLLVYHGQTQATATGDFDNIFLGAAIPSSWPVDEITIPNPWPVDEDTPLIIDFSPYENDRYGESVASNLTWYVSSYDNTKIASISGQNSSTDIIKFTPVTDWWGNTTVTMTLVDANGTTASQNITLQWLPVNEQSYISPSIPDPSAMDEDNPIIIDLTNYENDNIYEDNNESLKWYVTSYDTRYIERVTGQNSTDDILSIFPQYDWYGTTNITLVLWDTGGLRAYQVINLAWLPVNDDPYISPTIPNPWPVDEDTPLIVDFSAYENDRYSESIAGHGTGNLTWYVSNYDNTQIASISGQNSSTDIIRFVPVADWFGTTTVTMILVDADGTTASQNVTLTWLNVNDQSYIWTPITDRSANEDNPIIMNLTYHEADNYYENDSSNLKWYCTSYDTRYIKYITGENSSDDVIFVYPQDNWYGTTNITLVLIDSGGSKAHQTINLGWIPVNDDPYISPAIPNPWPVDEDTPLIMDFTAYENDRYGESIAGHGTGNLTWYVSSYDNTKIASISGQNSSTDIIKLTAAPDWFGTTTVTMTVVDANGTTASQVITLQWLAVGDTPYITNLPQSLIPSTVPEDNSASLWLTNCENDHWGESNNASLKWWVFSYDRSVITSVSGENSTNDIITFTPKADWYGPTDVTLMLEDGDGMTTLQTVTLTWTPVLESPRIMNMPDPMVLLPSPTTVGSDNKVSINLKPYELDHWGESVDTNLTWYASSYDPSIVTGISGQNSSNDVITFTLRQNWHGITPVTLTLRDGDGMTNSKTIYIQNGTPDGQFRFYNTNTDYYKTFYVELPWNATIINASLQFSGMEPWEPGVYREVVGGVAYDRFGYSVTAADVNGDSYADVIVGTSYSSSSSANKTGKAHIFYGSRTGISTTPNVTIQGSATADRFGASVSYAGDLNGDGIDDLAVGAPDATVSGNANTGKVYIFYGTLASGIQSGNADTVASIIITGRNSGDKFGTVVASAGDVNNDGYGDLLVSAPPAQSRGEIYVFHGSSTGITQTSASNANTKLLGDQSNNLLGTSISSAGDINNDGYDDIIVSAPYYSDNTDPDPAKRFSNCGKVYICLGSSSGIYTGSITTISSISGIRGIVGKQSYQQFGVSVAGVGDINGDGYADIAVGAPNTMDESSSTPGRVYIYHGNANGIVSAGNTIAASDSTYAKTIINGENNYDNFGYRVAGIGDINKDGYSDLAVSATKYDVSSSDDYGRVYIFTGAASGIGASGVNHNPINVTAGIIDGERSKEIGQCIAAGDIDDDGFSDLILGAPSTNNSGLNESGRAYVFDGSAVLLFNWPSSGASYYPLNVSLSVNTISSWQYFTATPITTSNSPYPVTMQYTVSIEDDSVNGKNFIVALNQYLYQNRDKTDADGYLTVPIKITSNANRYSPLPRPSTYGSWSTYKTYRDYYRMTGSALGQVKVTVSESLSKRADYNLPSTSTAEIPNLGFNEDENLTDIIDLDNYFSDGDSWDTLLHYSYQTYGHSHIGVNIASDGKVSFYSLTPDWYGQENITFYAYDNYYSKSYSGSPYGGSYGIYASDTIIVTVYPVNDAPIISPSIQSPFYVASTESSGFMAKEDNPLFLLLTTYESDHWGEGVNANLTWTVMSYDENVIKSISGQNSSDDNITITPADNYHGTTPITLRLWDANGAYVDQVTYITWISVNENPTINGTIGYRSANEDNTITIDFNDIAGIELDVTNESTDNGLVWYVVSYNSSAIKSISGQNSTSDALIFTPQDDWYGLTYVTIALKDEGDLTNTQIIALGWNSTNDAPIISPSIQSPFYVTSTESSGFMAKEDNPLFLLLTTYESDHW
ncbi:MAG: hypothetical protein WC974_07750, partial [Thermoplasmata archaeon]